MFDIWIGDVELSNLLLVLVPVLLAAGQTLLCFKVRSLAVRLLPAAVLLSLAAALFVMSLKADGWSALGFFLIALMVLGLVVSCGLGWILWAVLRRARRKKSRQKSADQSDNNTEQ